MFNPSTSTWLRWSTIRMLVQFLWCNGFRVEFSVGRSEGQWFVACSLHVVVLVIQTRDFAAHLLSSQV